MPRPLPRHALLFFLLVPLACVVEGDEDPTLGELEAVRQIEVAAGAIHPANCGHTETLEIELTNASGRQVTAWALFRTEVRFRSGTTAGQTESDRIGVEPIQLAPGESTTFSLSDRSYTDLSDVFIDITGAQVLVSNMDPTDTTEPEVIIESRDRCDAADGPTHVFNPISFDPTGVAYARQSLAEITPEICPFREQSGAVVLNSGTIDKTVWAAWRVDPATLSGAERSLFGDDPTIFQAPIRVAPGEEVTFGTAMPTGVDATEVIVMMMEGGLAIRWFDTCGS